VAVVRSKGAIGMRHGHSTLGGHYTQMQRTVALVGLVYEIMTMYTVGGAAEGACSLPSSRNGRSTLANTNETRFYVQHGLLGGWKDEAWFVLVWSATYCRMGMQWCKSSGQWA